MNTFQDIADRLTMHWPQNANEELRDTLDALVQLEADLHTLCREVASLSIDHFSKAYATSPEFDQMMDRRGVVLPDLA
jgi:hypothetical protein